MEIDDHFMSSSIHGEGMSLEESSRVTLRGNQCNPASDEGEESSDDEEEDAFDELFGTRSLSRSESESSLDNLAENLMQQAAKDFQPESLSKNISGLSKVNNDIRSTPVEPLPAAVERTEENDVSKFEGEILEAPGVKEIVKTLHNCSKGEGDEVGTRFRKDVPMRPEDTWDFSLQALIPNYKSKCLWIEGPAYQKFLGECFHEMQNNPCPCKEQKKIATCRICHTVFCSAKCFKQTMKIITAGKAGDTDDTDEMEPAPSESKIEPELQPKLEASKSAKKYQDKIAIPKQHTECKSKAVTLEKRPQSTSEGAKRKQLNNRKEGERQPLRNNQMIHPQQASYPVVEVGGNPTPMNLWPSQVLMNATGGVHNVGVLEPSPTYFPGTPSHSGLGLSMYQQHPLSINPVNPELQSKEPSLLGLPHQVSPQITRTNNMGTQLRGMLNIGGISTSVSPPDNSKNANPGINIRNNIGQGPSFNAQLSSCNSPPRNSGSGPESQMQREYEAPVKILRNPGPPEGLPTSPNYGHSTANRQPESRQGIPPAIQKTSSIINRVNFTNQSLNPNLPNTNFPGFLSNHQPQGRSSMRHQSPQSSIDNVQPSNERYSSKQSAREDSYNGARQRSSNSQSSSGAEPMAGTGHSFAGYQESNPYTTNKHRDFNRKDTFNPNPLPTSTRGNAYDTADRRGHNPEKSLSVPTRTDNRKFESKQKQSSSSYSSDSDIQGNQSYDTHTTTYQNERKSSLVEAGDGNGPKDFPGSSYSSPPPPKGFGRSRDRKFSDQHSPKSREFQNKLRFSETTPATSSSGHRSMESSKDKHNPRSPMKSRSVSTEVDSQLQSIQLEPEIPVGIRMPVTHLRGNSFFDFSVMALKNLDTFKILHAAIQESQNLPMHVFEVGDFCLAKYPSSDENGAELEWYRGVVTKVVGKVGIYFLDIGVCTVLSPTSICELPSEMKSCRPLAIRMRCLNLKLENEDNQDVKEHFESLVRQPIIKVRVTHKDAIEPFQYAGYLDVLHLTKWFDVGILLKKFQIGETGSTDDVAKQEKENLLTTLTPTNPPEIQLKIPNFSNSPVEVEAIISHVKNANEFYITTLDSISRRQKIENQLNALGVAMRAKPVSSLMDLSLPVLMLTEESTETWIRVKVLEVATSAGPVSVVVQKIDYGDIITVPMQSLKQISANNPSPACAYKCSLPVEPVTMGRLKLKAFNEHPTHHLLELCDMKVTLNILIYMIENSNTHIVELFLENARSGITSSFLQNEWVKLSRSVDLTRPKN